MTGYTVSSSDFTTAAKAEGVSSAVLRRKVRDGVAVIPHNRRHALRKPCAIGEGLRVKVNANIGTSPAASGIQRELEKVRVAVAAGADAIMDLSTGGDLRKIRRAILKESPVPVGTVPIYQTATDTLNKRRLLSTMTADELLDTLREQAAEGVDFFTIHAGLTYAALERIKRQGRLIPVVSRGGAFLIDWMRKNKRENPFYERFEEVLAIAREYNVTLSLGDGLRPGTVVDSTDRPQIHELIILGELVRECRKNGVQAMVEGPGHVPLNHIAANIQLQKRLCEGAPFYVLGPLVTDSAPGYDHITSAIGGAFAAWCGADFLCYVTPSEHVALPDVEDVRMGVVASRIAAHAADLARGEKRALARDRAMSQARFKRDWAAMKKLALDSAGFCDKIQNTHKDVCSMCDEFCSMKLVQNV